MLILRILWINLISAAGRVSRKRMERENREKALSPQQLSFTAAT